MCSWKKDYQIQDYLNADYEKWRDREYIFQRGPQGEWLSHTFGETIEDVWAVSRELLRDGYGGRNIGLYGANCYEWMVLNLSVMGYVGVCFPINVEFREDDLRHILAESDLGLFLYTPEKETELSELSVEFPGTRFMTMEQCLWKAREMENEVWAGTGARNRAGLGAEAEAVAGFSPRDADETVDVLFTSGTAAEPKAVMLSQRNLFHNWPALYQRTPMNDTDRLYLALPLSHVYAGVAAFLYTIISGMRIYLGSPDPAVCAGDFQTVRPTVFIGVPLLMERFYLTAMEQGRGLFDFFGGEMKYLYCGGSPIRQALKDECVAAGLPLLEAYGISETSSVVALDVQGDYREGSAGVVLSGLDVRVFEPDEKGVGEIIIRGGSVMSGYFHNEALTTSSFDDQGFFHSGDLGRLDDSGHLYIIGRKKRMLLTGNGRNVYPDEIEALACENPIIKRARMTQRGNRFHLTAWHEGSRRAAEEWLTKTNERLPGYKRFAELTLVEDGIGKRIK